MSSKASAMSEADYSGFFGARKHAEKMAGIPDKDEILGSVHRR
jgi:hypothetical protein